MVIATCTFHASIHSLSTAVHHGLSLGTKLYVNHMTALDRNPFSERLAIHSQLVSCALHQITRPTLPVTAACLTIPSAVRLCVTGDLMAMEMAARAPASHWRQAPVPPAQWRREDIAHPAALAAFLRHDKTANTRATYNVHVRQFEVMREQCLGLPTGQAPSALQLAQFIMGRTMHNYKFSYIELGVYAITAWAQEDFGISDMQRQPLVTRALRAAAHMAVQWKAQKLPITSELLSRMLQSVSALAPNDPFIRARDAALWQVAWCGMFRCSEVLAIQWQDVLFCDRGAMILVRRSKTDPGKGAWVLLADGATGRLTPALALKQLHAMTGGHPAAHAFARHLGACDPIAKATMTARLHKLLAVVGIERETAVWHTLAQAWGCDTCRQIWHVPAPHHAAGQMAF